MTVLRTLIQFTRKPSVMLLLCAIASAAGWRDLLDPLQSHASVSSRSLGADGLSIRTHAHAWHRAQRSGDHDELLAGRSEEGAEPARL